MEEKTIITELAMAMYQLQELQPKLLHYSAIKPKSKSIPQIPLRNPPALRQRRLPRSDAFVEVRE